MDLIAQLQVSFYRRRRGAFYGMALVIGWIAGLAFRVAARERRLPERQWTVAKGPIRWGIPYERVGAMFGQQYSPLVGFWVRFYVRNRRFRAAYLLTLPLAGFLIYQMGYMGRHPIGVFAAALRVFPMCGFFCTSRFAVNLFGYLLHVPRLPRLLNPWRLLPGMSAAIPLNIIATPPILIRILGQVYPDFFLASR